MDKPTHAQSTTELTEAGRELVRRGADLCRADPALWSYTVRLQDYLIAQGMDRDEAHRQSLEGTGF